MPRTPEAVRRTGSHFLSRDSPWVKRMVEAAALKPGESVLDAGAGAGSITALLADAVQPTGSVLAVETDATAAAALRRLARPEVRVVEGDVLKVKLPHPLHAVVANPPFRLLPALLRRLLKHGFGRAVLVMPRELADRLTAAPKVEGYGRLTVEVGVRAKSTLLFPLPRKAFDPPPAVACAVVQVVPKSGLAGAPFPEAALDAVLEAAWTSPRRHLRHSLAPLAQGLGLPPQDVTDALVASNAQDRTALDLSPWEYGELARRLEEAREARGAALGASKEGSRQNP